MIKPPNIARPTKTREELERERDNFWKEEFMEWLPGCLGVPLGILILLLINWIFN